MEQVENRNQVLDAIALLMDIQAKSEAAFEALMAGNVVAVGRLLVEIHQTSGGAKYKLRNRYIGEG